VASEFQEKIRSIGHLSRGRTQSRIREGRSHPESGEPYKATQDELGHVVTEHGKAGSGVSDRQDVLIHAETVHLDLRAGQ
jgi:hypothetical protein